MTNSPAVPIGAQRFHIRTSHIEHCSQKGLRWLQGYCRPLFPKHNPRESVNLGISQDWYLGDPIHLRYPSVDNLVNLVRCTGPGCCLFKCDLSRAYRQLPVDPGDLHHLGYRWRGDLFIDVTLTMGLRSAAFLCQRVTTYIAKNNGVSISNYPDDFGGVEVKDSAKEAFLKLSGILKQSGLVESPAKAHWPNVRKVFLGIMVDTEQMVLEVSGGCCRTGWGGLQPPRNRHKAWWVSCSLWPSVSSQAKYSWPGCWIFSAVPRAGGVPHTGRSQGWLEMVADIPATLQWGFGHPWDRLVRSGCNVCLWCLSHWGRGVVSGPSYPHRVPGIHSRAGDAH